MWGEDRHSHRSGKQSNPWPGNEKVCLSHASFSSCLSCDHTSQTEELAVRTCATKGGVLHYVCSAERQGHHTDAHRVQCSLQAADTARQPGPTHQALPVSAQASDPASQTHIKSDTLCRQLIMLDSQELSFQAPPASVQACGALQHCVELQRHSQFITGDPSKVSHAVCCPLQAADTAQQPGPLLPGSAGNCPGLRPAHTGVPCKVTWQPTAAQLDHQLVYLAVHADTSECHAVRAN